MASKPKAKATNKAAAVAKSKPLPATGMREMSKLMNAKTTTAQKSRQ